MRIRYTPVSYTHLFANSDVIGMLGLCGVAGALTASFVGRYVKRVGVRLSLIHILTYTLAIVDDGLLDLTNFKTPDPWNDFYSREALGIRTWDMYDNVLGASAGSYSSLFSTGGDATLKPADAKANRFKPVVKFIGPFYLGKGKSQTHTLKLPMYVGSVRALSLIHIYGSYAL